MKLWNAKLVSILNEILPTYSELAEEPLELPCITYRLSSDAVVVEGDNLRYSRPIYQIKLYVKDLDDADYYLTLIDETLYKERFFRESFNEMVINNIHQYILNYSVSTVERIK